MNRKSKDLAEAAKFELQAQLIRKRERCNAKKRRACRCWLGEEDGNGSGSSVLQSLGSSPTRTPSLAWWFSPPAPNHKPQDRFGPWGLWLGVEDDLRTLTPRLIEEVVFAWAVGEVRCTVGDDPSRADVASVSALWRM